MSACAIIRQDFLKRTASGIGGVVLAKSVSEKARS